jgi:hypothetical protein
MRTSLVSLLAVLISIASTVPTGYSAHQGHVAARDPARVRSPPVTPPNLERNVKRAQPSKNPERRDNADHVPRAAAAPSAHPYKRDYAPRAQPSSKNGERRDLPHAPRAAAVPSGVAHGRRDQHANAPRQAESGGNTKRSSSQQIQDLFWKKVWGGSRWDYDDDDQCPTPLSACPVRGARGPDAIECVDLESDLYSCGGCAADDIVCVFFDNP